MEAVGTQARAIGATQGQGPGLLAGDLIVVTLTGKKGDGSRVSISHTFNAEGQQVDARGNAIEGRKLTIGAAAGAEPAFPTAQYTELVRSNLKAQADELTVRYYKDMESFRSNGGSSAAERILNGVLNFVANEHGVRQTDHQGFVLRKDEVVIKAPVRSSPDEEGYWLVQMTPTWG